MRTAPVLNVVRRNVIVRYYQYYIIDSVLIVRREGFKALIRKRGWKVLGFVVGYYLVRDSLVYIIIPYYVARGLF
jgi:hypothetical protein